jgi:hypothetical protein
MIAALEAASLLKHFLIAAIERKSSRQRMFFYEEALRSMGDDAIETIQTFRSLTVCEIFVELAWRLDGSVSTAPHESSRRLTNPRTA